MRKRKLKARSAKKRVLKRRNEAKVDCGAAAVISKSRVAGSVAHRIQSDESGDETADKNEAAAEDETARAACRAAEGGEDRAGVPLLPAGADAADGGHA